jgi:hypothetical protein
MSIKDACRPRAPVTTKFSKEGCIFLVAERRPFHININMIEVGLAPLT